MRVSSLLLRIKNYHRITLFLLALIVIGALALPIVFVLGFIVTMPIVFLINTILIALGLASLALLLVHLKMKSLNGLFETHDCFITHVEITSSVADLKSSYIYKSYDPKTEVYQTLESMAIHACLVKEVKEDAIGLWSKCKLENGQKVRIQNSLSNGITLVETDNNTRCILDASNLTLILKDA